jgi:hypothetical protein
MSVLAEFLDFIYSVVWGVSNRGRARDRDAKTPEEELIAGSARPVHPPGIGRPGRVGLDGVADLTRTVKFRPTTLQRGVDFLLATLFSALCLILPWQTLELGGGPLGLVLVWPCGAAAWHSWRSARQRVDIRADGIVVADMRTRFIPWSDVVDVGTRRFGVRELPYIETHDGERTDLWLLSRLPWGNKRNPKLARDLELIER